MRKTKTQHTPGPLQITCRVLSTADDTWVVESQAIYCREDADRTRALFLTAPEAAAERDRLKEINKALLEAAKALSDSCGEIKKVAGFMCDQGDYLSPSGIMINTKFIVALRAAIEKAEKA